MKISSTTFGLVGSSILFSDAFATPVSPFTCRVSNPIYSSPPANVSDEWCDANCIALDGTPNGHPACIYDISVSGSSVHTRCICGNGEVPEIEEPDPEQPQPSPSDYPEDPEPSSSDYPTDPDPSPPPPASPLPSQPTCIKSSSSFVITGVQENPAGSPASHNLLEGEWFKCTPGNCETSTLGSAFVDMDGYYRLTSKAGTRYVYSNQHGVQMAINELDSVMSVYFPGVNVGRQGGRFGFVWGVGTGKTATAFDGKNRGCSSCTVTMCDPEVNLFENLGFIISGMSNHPENPPISHNLIEGEFKKCTPSTCTDKSSLAHAHVDADGYYRLTSKAGTRYVYYNKRGVHMAINELDTVMSLYMPGQNIGRQGHRFGFVWGPGTATTATYFNNRNRGCPTCLTTIHGSPENPFKNLVAQPGFTIDGLTENPAGPPASQSIIEGDYHICTSNNCDTSRLGRAVVDSEGYYRLTTKAGSRYVYENQHKVQIAINELDSVMSIYLPGGSNPGKQGGRVGYIYGTEKGKMATWFSGKNTNCPTCTINLRGGLKLFANL
eukprot:Pgem_evm1s568